MTGNERPRAWALALVAVTMVALIGGCARVENTAPEPAAPTSSQAARWGVEVESIRTTAAGYMLDFRYRVVDADKARPLFKRQTKPYLIDEKTGARFIVPSPAKTGPLRSSDVPKPGRGYFMFFANPGGFVKAGDEVTVVIGDFRAENLVVR